MAKKKDYHKRNPVTFRPPADVQNRLERYAAQTGQDIGHVITVAVREKLDREGATSSCPPADLEKQGKQLEVAP